MTIRPKLMYLARRHPALSKEQFTPRWRQHGALGMSMPRWKNIWRYVHCDVLAHHSGNDDSQGYDGVGIVWHRSPEARRAHREDTSSQAAMEADEVQTFDRLVGNFCALMEEREVLARSDASVKLIRFQQRQGDVGRETCIEEWAPLQAATLMRLSGVAGRLRGYVQNHAMPSESGRPWGLRYDYIEELWFDTLDDAREAESALRSHLPGGPGLVSVFTNEVVLYDVSREAALPR